MKEFSQKQDKFILVIISFFLFISNGILNGQTPPLSNAIQVHVFDKSKIPLSIQYKGAIVDGAFYKDNRGEHILIISEYTKGEYFTKNYTSEIFAADYLILNNAFQQLWKIWDNSNSIFGTIGYEKGTLKIFDIDNDGKAESRFFYTTVFEGADPWKLKYMLHYNDIKLVIRGQIPVEEDSTQYRKEFDQRFDTCPIIFKELASKEWDKFIKSKVSNK